MAGEKHYATAMRLSYPEYARELEHAPSFAALDQATRVASYAAESQARFRRLVPDVTEDTMPGELANCTGRAYRQPV